MKIINKYFLKKVSQALVFFIIGALLISLTPFKTNAEVANLMFNSTVAESIDGLSPNGWYQDSWGNNNALFSYDKQGYDDASALSVKINSYADGDAKWYFAPVPVKSSTAYTYSDYYFSTTRSNIWARFISSDGTASYKWLGYAPASENWTSKSFDLTTTASTVGLSVLHVIDSVGSLTTDSFSLTENEAASCDSINFNGLLNSSFEQSCDNGVSAASWRKSSVGNISGDLTYENTGLTGNHSAGMNVTAANGGEVSWSFQPLNVSAGKRYQYSCWIKSNVGAYAYSEEQDKAGNYSYAPLMSAPSTGNVWSHYTDIFLAQTNTSLASVYLALDKVGSVRIDDCSLIQLPDLSSNNFNRGMVSITFDDGWRTTYTNGLSILNQFGYKGTFYVNYSNLDKSTYMTKKQVKTLANQGHEIGSHSYNHVNLTNLSDIAAELEIAQNKLMLSQMLGLNIKNFADPYGAYNSSVIDSVMKHHQSNRESSGMLNKKYSFNPRLVHSWGVDKNTSMTNINNLLNQAKAQKAWLILVYHDIPVGNGGAVDSISTTNFKKHLTAIKNSGLPVLTVDQALQEAKKQL